MSTTRPGTTGDRKAGETAEDRNVRRTLRGIVVSDKMDKTISVRVERTIRHSKYGKYIRRHKSYLAHDETGAAHPGDTVEIASCRPISKRKCWRLLTILAVSRAVESSTAEDARPDGLLVAQKLAVAGSETSGLSEGASS